MHNLYSAEIYDKYLDLIDVDFIDADCQLTRDIVQAHYVYIDLYCDSHKSMYLATQKLLSSLKSGHHGGAV